jgi:glycosyltransferase involved in cell wall biosynthesis
MLCQALHSILLQGHDDVELVINDGGPDRPVLQDPLVRQVLNLFGPKQSLEIGHDGGIFHAVNKCLKRATGDILYFMCDDDLLCPGALAAVSEAFERERFGGPYWVYGQTISAHITGRTQGIDGCSTTLDRMLVHNRLGQPAVFWNRNMMNLAGMFDTRFKWAADYDLWLRFWKCREPEFIGQTLGLHRHHEEQATRVNAADVEREAKMISWRQRSLTAVASQARTTLMSRKFYLDGIPESVN